MSHKVIIHPAGIEFTCQQEETILEAAERAGLVVPASCRNGVCWICEAKLLAGDVVDASQERPPTVGTEIRLCRTRAKTDLHIETETIHPENQLPQHTLACQIQEITALNDQVHRVRLSAPAGVLPVFHPGQYLSLNIPDMEPAYFSIASQPGQREIELHIEAPPEKEVATRILRYLTNNPVVSLTLPFGEACLPDSMLSDIRGKHVVLVAAGTGYAQVRSIAQRLFTEKVPLKRMDLFWGGRRKEDLYCLEEPEAWQQAHRYFHLYPLYADNEDNAWPGHHDQLAGAVLNNAAIRDSLTRNAIYVFASGSPAMVYGILDALCEQGMSASHFYSDVLAYAPRDSSCP